MDPIKILLLALGVFAAGYLIVFIAGLVRDVRDGQSLASKPMMYVVSFIANFFDTLGVGSFATTTSMVRFFKLIPDEKIPGSLNVGYVLPTIIQAYVTIHGVTGLVTVEPIQVDPRTLITLIGSAVLGAWLGAGIVSGWPRRKIQVGMGLCLAAAAIIMLARITFFHSLTEGTIGLTGVKWIIGMVGLFVLGALMTLGIGLYAPCFILVSLLGLTPQAAFPIMMGSCAFLMPPAGARFIALRRYDMRAALGLALGGIPAVLIAAFIVKSLPLVYLRWLVVIVVVYTALAMLRSAILERRAAADRVAA
jgi:uncharacterized membrane protein YfcA